MTGPYPAEQEPDGEVIAPHHFYLGVLAAWFGFQYVWPHYAVTGSLLALGGLLVALDDVVSHALGWPTPLDLLWTRVIYPVVQRVER